MNKSIMLARDIGNYHPGFKNRYNRYILKHNPELIAYEKCIEVALVHASDGLYTHTPEYGRDFSDNSDCKTASVNEKTGKAEIGSIETKFGALRIIIWNPFTVKLDYMYIPYKDVIRLRIACYGNQSHKLRIVPTWSTKNNTYNQFQKFLLPTFKALATATG